MPRTRIKLAVLVDLDPVPGAMHTAESAQHFTQLAVSRAMESYNPSVSIESHNVEVYSSPSPMLQLEIAIHDADCPGHDESFTGHGDKYHKMALAAMAVFPPDREPWWIKDRKMFQEATINRMLTLLEEVRSNQNVQQ